MIFMLRKWKNNTYMIMNDFMHKICKFSLKHFIELLLIIGVICFKEYISPFALSSSNLFFDITFILICYLSYFLCYSKRNIGTAMLFACLLMITLCTNRPLPYISIYALIQLFLFASIILIVFYISNRIFDERKNHILLSIVQFVVIYIYFIIQIEFDQDFVICFDNESHIFRFDSTCELFIWPIVYGIVYFVFSIVVMFGGYADGKVVCRDCNKKMVCFSSSPHPYYANKYINLYRCEYCNKEVKVTSDEPDM